MSRYRKIFNRVLPAIFLVIFLSNNVDSYAADGKALFKANCASCHKVNEKFAGPALKGWKDRVPGGDWIYKWIANPADQKDPYATKLMAEYKPTIMTPFPQLKKEEVDAILKYVDDWVPDTPP
ncbi:MAG TPA: cytochrome c, partial [Ferruginibacter sp.]|nr:cytochrome c [Ferruginibacter sp.]